MRIREWGKVCDQARRLGDAECCVYLIQGRKTTLMLNGGLAVLVPQVLDQLCQLGRTPADIDAYPSRTRTSTTTAVCPISSDRNPP